VRDDPVNRSSSLAPGRTEATRAERRPSSSL
jgi:hypothetical protein